MQNLLENIYDIYKDTLLCALPIKRWVLDELSLRVELMTQLRSNGHSPLLRIFEIEPLCDKHAALFNAGFCSLTRAQRNAQVNFSHALENLEKNSNTINQQLAKSIYLATLFFAVQNIHTMFLQNVVSYVNKGNLSDLLMGFDVFFSAVATLPNSIGEVPKKYPELNSLCTEYGKLFNKIANRRTKLIEDIKVIIAKSSEKHGLKLDPLELLIRECDCSSCPEERNYFLYRFMVVNYANPVFELPMRYFELQDKIAALWLQKEKSEERWGVVAMTHPAHMTLWSSDTTAVPATAGLEHKVRAELLQEVANLLEQYIFKRTEMLLFINVSDVKAIELGDNNEDVKFARSLILLRQNKSLTESQKSTIESLLANFISAPFPSYLKKEIGKNFAILRTIARNKIYACFILYALQMEAIQGEKLRFYDTLNLFASKALALAKEFNVPDGEMLKVLLQICFPGEDVRCISMSINIIKDVWVEMAKNGYDFSGLIDDIFAGKSLYRCLITPENILEFVRGYFNKQTPIAVENRAAQVEYAKILIAVLSQDLGLSDEVSRRLSFVQLENLGYEQPLTEQIKFMQCVCGVTADPMQFDIEKLSPYCETTSDGAFLLPAVLRLEGQLHNSCLSGKISQIRTILLAIQVSEIPEQNKIKLVTEIFTVINEKYGLFSGLGVLLNQNDYGDEDLTHDIVRACPIC
jgi:hypothetical protein